MLQHNILHIQWCWQSDICGWWWFVHTTWIKVVRLSKHSKNNWPNYVGIRVPNVTSRYLGDNDKVKNQWKYNDWFFRKVKVSNNLSVESVSQWKVLYQVAVYICLFALFPFLIIVFLFLLDMSIRLSNEWAPIHSWTKVSRIILVIC